MESQDSNDCRFYTERSIGFGFRRRILPPEKIFILLAEIKISVNRHRGMDGLHN
jgi:hypothetical protein